MKEWIHNRIHNMKIFKEVDDLLDDLYKYTRFAVTLRHLNTREHTETYRRLNPFDKRLTYIWDETESMDDLIRGWIPNRLLDILKQKKIKGSMKDIKELISDWVMKIVKFIKGYSKEEMIILQSRKSLIILQKLKSAKFVKIRNHKMNKEKGKFLVNEAIIIISLMIKYMKLLNEQ